MCDNENRFYRLALPCTLFRIAFGRETIERKKNGINYYKNEIPCGG